MNILAVVLTLLLMPADALGHDAAQHLDPELLTGWRTWLHLTIQWAHLVGFALWMGLTAGTLLMGMKPSLDRLLYSSWILFLLLFATGTYNMEWSAGISETPSLFLLPSLERIPYGVTYTVVLAVKVALYGLSVLLTLVVTTLHLRRRHDEARLRKVFLVFSSSLGILLTLVVAVLLFYHEAADVWPTAVHSLGGVMGPEGPRGQTRVDGNVAPPNDFRLLASRDAWIDIGLRWIHLLGFGLLTGGSASVLVFGGAPAKRFILFSWVVLLFQLLSGIASMGRWTPFYLSPYIWNLGELSDLRFGKSYTLFMSIKHLLVLGAVCVLVTATVRYWKFRGRPRADQLDLRPFVAASLFLGLVIGYIMIIVLLLHEGVDHAL